MSLLFDLLPCYSLHSTLHKVPEGPSYNPDLTQNLCIKLFCSVGSPQKQGLASILPRDSGSPNLALARFSPLSPAFLTSLSPAPQRLPCCP